MGLILSDMILTLPFTIWTLTAFMRTLPKELEEAAVIDGAGPWTVLLRVFLPLLAPALATTGLLAFIAAWNEFLFALTLTLDRARTVPVVISQISGASQHELPWGVVMAASVVVTVPRGQFVAVLGPSGCGKSTLLMMLGGLEAVTAGRIAVGGEPMTGARTSIGIMFQDPTPVAVEERARQRAVPDPCPEAAAR